MFLLGLATLIDNSFDMPSGMHIQPAMKIHDRGALASSYYYFNGHNLTKPYRSNMPDLNHRSLLASLPP